MKIGLMYVSDYGYGANPEKWTLSLNSDSSNYGTDNWLYLGSNEWLISRFTGTSVSALHVNSNNGGNVRFDSVYDTYAIRPFFSLASTVEITSGTGTSTDPFILQTN